MDKLFEHINQWPIYIFPIVGLAFLFLGLKLFKFLLATSCALSLGFAAWYACEYFKVPEPWMCWTATALAALIGLVLASALHRLGAFLLGFAGGLFISPLIIGLLPTSPDWLPIAATAALALVIGLIAMISKDRVIIIMTSLYGAGLFTHSFFVILMRHDIVQKKHFSSPELNYSIVFLLLYVCMAVVGFVHQAKQKKS
jgi:hypothetical protein